MKEYEGLTGIVRNAFEMACRLVLALGLVIGISSGAFAASPGDIVTIAGGGVGDNGAAISANLYNSKGVTVDSAGNIYIADYNNHRIRKVAAGSGTITTVAGNGAMGLYGDGGPATSASLYCPSGVAIDSIGNLYIADTNNSRIRKVAAGTGIITTVAGNGSPTFVGDGGLATSASLAYPRGIAIDNAGNLYIADLSNNRIRKIDAGSGIITTVAGNGAGVFAGDGGLATSASLKFPAGVAVDNSGNLFIADSNNHRIRKVDAGTGIITTVAGNGTAAFSGDGGQATASNLWIPCGVTVDIAGNLYIADTGNSRIRKIDTSSGIITTVAGNSSFGFAEDGVLATSTSIWEPYGVAVDNLGNMFIADYGNHRIRKVIAGSGIISTVAGNGSAGYFGDDGIATSANVNFPEGSAIDNVGNVYIAESYGNRIRKVAAGSGIITTVAGNGVYGYSGDGVPATSATLSNPASVTADNAGNLYIADFNNHRIRKIAAETGIITTVAGSSSGFDADNIPASSASLNGPSGIALDSAGNLYIADRYNNRIRKVDATTGIITTVAGNGIGAFAGDGGSAVSASIYTPYGVALDKDGNLYIADCDNNRIRKVDAVTGIITTVAGNGNWNFSGDGGPATSASFKNVTGVAVDAIGNIYIADSGNYRVRMVAAGSGIITTVAGNGNSSFTGDNGPAILAGLHNTLSGVTIDRGGNLYIADKYNNRIRKVIKPGATTAAITYSPAGPYKAGDVVTITATFNDLVADAPVPQIALGGANMLAATDMTKVDYTRYSYTHTVTADFAGTVYVIPTGMDFNGIPLSSLPVSGAVFSVIAPPNVSGGTVSVVSTTGATLNATAYSNGVITAVTFNYGLTSAYGSTAAASQSPLAADGGGAVSATISGLSCGTTYHYRVSAQNSAGTANGLDTTFTTTACPPPGSIIINTVAGNGTAIFAGDGGAATSASLYYPRGVATDSFGNVYIADTFNYRIRKLVPGSGIISTVAGVSTSGFGGDGGLATAAKINCPYGVTVDSAGNIYIADTYNHRIRKVNAATGIITTVAGNGSGAFAGDGGPAISASINNPIGVAVDSAGNLYISDTNNNRIRRVDAATGIITTVAGNGTGAFAGDGGPATSASIYRPQGITLDNDENLYIADYMNLRIRKVEKATGIISTVAGKSATGLITYTGEGGPATSATLPLSYGVTVDRDRNIFIAEGNSSRILKVDATSGIISTVAGNGIWDIAGDGGLATTASLKAPTGVTIDSAGNLYVADTNNHRIRKVSKPGATTAAITYSPAGPYKAGDVVTITAVFNDLVADAPAPQIALSGANTLAATAMTKVDYTRYSYTHTVAAGNGSVTVSIPTGIDTNNIPLSSIPVSGATFTVFIPPVAPTNIEIQPPMVKGQLVITWTKPVDVAFSHLHIYRSATAGQLGARVVDNLDAIKLVDTGLSSQTTYYYTVRTVDSVGNESTNTAQVSAITLDATPPNPPTGGNAVDATTGGKLNLTWSASPEADVAYYRIYRSYEGIFYDLVHTNVTGTAFSDTGLTNGHQYFYSFTAVDTSGNESTQSSAHGIVTGTPTAPDTTPPGLISCSGTISQPLPLTGDKLQLNWINPTDPDYALTRIYASTAINQLGTKIYEGNGTAFLHGGLTAGSTYYYTYRPVDTGNNESTNSVQCDYTPLDNVPSACPTELSAVLNPDNSITVSWVRSASPDIYSYQIFASNGTDPISYAAPAATVNHPAVSWTSAVLTQGNTYQFGIRTVDNLLTSPNVSGNCGVISVAVPNPSPSCDVSSSIKVPHTGKKLGGNRTTVIAEVTSGSESNQASVLFQYRVSGLANSWIDIPSTDQVTFPNPDSNKPWFVHWNLTGLADNTDYDIRAVATCTNAAQDAAPGYITVTVNRSEPDSEEDDNGNGEHRKTEKVGGDADCNIVKGDDNNGVTRITLSAQSAPEGTHATVTESNPLSKAALVPGDHENGGCFREIYFDDGRHVLDNGKKANLEIPYKDDDNDGIVDGTTIHAHDLQVCDYDSELSKWICLDSTVDTNNKSIKAKTGTFSLFGLLVPPKPLAAGWNLVAVPLMPSPATPSSIFGSAAYFWNPLTSGYQAVSVIEPGKAYWVRNGFTSIRATGTETPAANFSIPIKKGWNLIGNPFRFKVKVNDLQITNGSTVSISIAEANSWVIGTLFNYTGGGYLMSTFQDGGTLDPWKGYWILSDIDGTLIVPNTPAL